MTDMELISAQVSARTVFRPPKLTVLDRLSVDAPGPLPPQTTGSVLSYRAFNSAGANLRQTSANVWPMSDWTPDPKDLAFLASQGATVLICSEIGRARTAHHKTPC